MDDLWTKKRGFVNPNTSNSSRSPISKTSFVASQRKELGGLSFVKTYLSTGVNTEIISKSYNNNIILDIKEDIYTLAQKLKSEYITTHYTSSDSDAGPRISIRDPNTLAETSHVQLDDMDFISSPNGYSEVPGYPNFGSYSNAVWDHKNNCFIIAVTYRYQGMYGDDFHLWSRIFSIGATGQIIKSDEVYHIVETVPGWSLVPHYTAIGNSISVVNNTIKDNIWLIRSWERDPVPKIHSITNGLASGYTEVPHCRGRDSDGMNLTVPGKETWNGKPPGETDYWGMRNITGVNYKNIETAILEWDESIKLYNKDGEWIQTLNSSWYADHGGFETAGGGFYYRINYMVGTGVLSVDRRDVNPRYYSDTCYFIKITGEIVGSVNEFNGDVLPGGWGTYRGNGVGERVTIINY